MTTRTRPTDAEFQQMGIVVAETMLPPSTSMILAGSRALSDAALKAAPSTVVIERIFAAMVLEGLQEIERLGATVTAGPITRQRRHSDTEPAPLAQASSFPLTHSGCLSTGVSCTSEGCEYPLCQQAGVRGSGATVTVQTNAPGLAEASNGILSEPEVVVVYGYSGGRGPGQEEGTGATAREAKPPQLQESTPGDIGYFNWLKSVNPFFAKLLKKGE